MWAPRHLTTLWAFTACYSDSFTFFLPLPRQRGSYIRTITTSVQLKKNLQKNHYLSCLMQTVLQIRIKNQLFYFTCTDITRTFCHGGCSTTTDLFRTKVHMASAVLHQIFTAVSMKMYKTCYASRGSRFWVRKSKT
jgi:hypothetical protein